MKKFIKQVKCMTWWIATYVASTKNYISLKWSLRLIMLALLKFWKNVSDHKIKLI